MRFNNSVSIATLLVAACLLSGISQSSLGQEEKKASGTEQTKPGEMTTGNRPAGQDVGPDVLTPRLEPRPDAERPAYLRHGALAFGTLQQGQKKKPYYSQTFEYEIDGNAGSVRVGPIFGPMKPGEYVEVALRSSGGKLVEWRLYNVNGNHLLKEIKQNAGDRKRIWTNDTERNIRVRFFANPDALPGVNVRITGTFDFYR